MIVIIIATAFAAWITYRGQEMKGLLDTITAFFFLAMAFSAQLLPVTIDLLFLRKGSRAGAIAGLAAGLVGRLAGGLERRPVADLAESLAGPLVGVLAGALAGAPGFAKKKEGIERAAVTERDHPLRKRRAGPGRPVRATFLPLPRSDA